MPLNRTILSGFILWLYNFTFVTPQPMITDPLDMLNQPLGGSVTFSVTLTGNLESPVIIRWTHNSVQIENMTGKYSGADTLSLTVSNLVAEDAGNYELFVLVDVTPLFSMAAMLTILLPPEISAHPNDQLDVHQGSSAGFDVTVAPVAGVTLSYHWQFSGVDIDPSNTSKYSGVNSDQLTIMDVQEADNGIYRCRVKNMVDGNSEETISNSIQLTVLLIPTISVQPMSVAVDPGDTAVLTVTANGESLQYQWFTVDTGGDLQLNDSLPDISGSTTRTLIIQDVTEANHDGETYYCRVSNPAGMIDSNTATISVASPPEITMGPQSLVNQIPGENVQFTVEATGTAPLGYEWRMNGVVLVDNSKYSGATTATLTVNNIVFPDDEGIFTVVISNTAGSFTSTPATLDIIQPIAFIVQPENQTIAAGETAMFSVMVTGDSPIYQWQMLNGVVYINLTDNSEYSGVNGQTLSVLAANSSDEGTYRALVSNGANSVPSNTVILSVVFHIIFTTQPEDQINVLPGAEVMFTCIVSGTGLTYQWSKNNVILEDMEGILSGTNTTILTIISAREPEDEGIYNCVVIYIAGVFTSNDATLSIINCPLLGMPINGDEVTFTTEPLPDDAGYSIGTEATYRCIASALVISGDSTRTCQNNGTWTGMVPVCTAITCSDLGSFANGTIDYKMDADDAAPYDFGTVATYSCNSGYSLSGGSQRTCTGDGNSTVGQFSGVAPTCEPIVCLDLGSLANGTIDYIMDADNAAPYDFGIVATYSCNSGYSLSGGSQRTCTGDGNSTVGQFSDVAPTCEPIVCLDLGSLANGTIDYTMDADNAAPYDFGTVATYSCNSGYSLSGDTERTCTGDGSSTVGAFDSEAPTCELQPIEFTAQPEDQTIAAGETATFSVMVTGDSPTYQWQRLIGEVFMNLMDGSEYSGVNGLTLSVTAVDSDDEGMYRVLVSNGTSPAAVSSNIVSLSVVFPPVITTPPEDQIDILPGTEVVFTCIANGTGIRYQWSKNNMILQNIDGIVSGTNTSTLTVINAREPEDEGSYNCGVVNIAGAVATSNGATLSIINCPPLDMPVNGDITFKTDLLPNNDGNSIGTVAIYSCVRGQLLSGNITRICQSDGNWTGIEPVCLERPDPPVNVTASIIGARWIVLTWIPTFTGDQSLTNFSLFLYSVDVSENFTEISSVLASDIMSTGENLIYNISAQGVILPYTNYSFAVVACNTIGCSDQSDLSTVIRTNQDTSSPPTITETMATQTTIMIMWTEPNLPNGRITAYEISYFGSRSFNPEFSDVNSSTFTIGELGSPGTNGFSQTLTELTPSTRYEVSVFAINGAGNGMADSVTVITQSDFETDSVLIQLRLTGIDKCQSWVEIDARKKLDAVNVSLANRVEERCQCGFNVLGIAEPRFRCFVDSESAVTYRASITGTDRASLLKITQYIEQWVEQGAAIEFEFVIVPVDNACSVVITSILDPECNNVMGTSILPLIGGITATFALLIIVLVSAITIIVFIRCRNKRKRSSNATANRPEIELVVTKNPNHGYEDINLYREEPPVEAAYEEVSVVFSSTEQNQLASYDVNFDISENAAYAVTSCQPDTTHQ